MRDYFFTSKLFPGYNQSWALLTTGNSSAHDIQEKTVPAPGLIAGFYLQLSGVALAKETHQLYLLQGVKSGFRFIDDDKIQVDFRNIKIFTLLSKCERAI